MLEFCKICRNNCEVNLIKSHNNTNYYKCSNCGVIKSDVKYNQNLQQSSSIDFYSNHYNLTDISFVNKHVDMAKNLLNSFNKYTNNIKEKILLDFGCGIGFFLFAAGDLNYHDAIGIDYNTETFNIVFKTLNKKYDNIHMYNKLDELKAITCKPNIIFMWHTLEHLEDPENILNNIIEIAEDKFYLFIQVPSFINNYFCDTHYYYYNEETFKYLLKDFSILNISRDSNNFITVASLYERQK